MHNLTQHAFVPVCKAYNVPFTSPYLATDAEADKVRLTGHAGRIRALTSIIQSSAARPKATRGR